MADSSTSVRFLQHHLRQAGALLASRDLDAAAAHIEAALAIDPASPAALTLRQRLDTHRAQQPSESVPGPSGAVAPSSSASRSRFVPAGVNATSWLDFEQRVQERRFRALIETAERAAAAHDVVAARVALEEARELRPDAREIEDMAERIAPIMAARPDVEAAPEPIWRSRTFRAASLLMVGVTALMGLDWVRSDAPPQTGAQAVARAVPESLPASSPASLAPAAVIAQTAVPPSVPPQPTVPPDEPRATSGRALEPLTADGIARVDVTSAARAAEPRPPVISTETPDDFVALPTRVVREQTPVSAPVVIRGDVPDDYVAPRREQVVRVESPAPIVRPAPAGSAPAAASGPLANIARQPAPITEPLGARGAVPPPSVPATPPATPAPSPTPAVATAAAAVTVPTDDSRTRVASVLQQYTRAYGQLDARAVRAIWPSVDERALAKAFASLSSQSVSFEHCDIDVAGATAKASCRGRASYVGKVGGQEPRTEPRTVNFELRRDGEAWKIQKAEARR